MKLTRQKRTSPTLTKKESLEYSPIKNPDITEKRLEKGEMMITYHISTRPWIANLMRHIGRRENNNFKKKIQLDELGTTVWDMMDGKNSVKQIINKFATKYQVHPKEAEVSVTSFIKILGKRGIIGLK